MFDGYILASLEGFWGLEFQLHDLPSNWFKSLSVQFIVRLVKNGLKELQGWNKSREGQKSNPCIESDSVFI